jgi:uncharacterized coiled-coil protein SlyX
MHTPSHSPPFSHIDDAPPSLRRTGTRALLQLVPRFTPPEVAAAADERLQALLNAAYADTQALLARNRAALDALVEALLARDSLDGAEVRAIVEAHGDAGDLRRRADQKATFL